LFDNGHYIYGVSEKSQFEIIFALDIVSNKLKAEVLANKRKQRQDSELFDTISEQKTSEADALAGSPLSSSNIKNSELKKAVQLCFNSIGIITGVAD